jgi:hypothetical protein
VPSLISFIFRRELVKWG